eukprot:INCI16146.10.p1 GENE.INCI16146.10~~INCI16146.10.p1  ORF type:complete len:356 (-),score=71.81 INCI16146.10:2289-3356(-)
MMSFMCEMVSKRKHQRGIRRHVARVTKRSGTRGKRTRRSANDDATAGDEVDDLDSVSSPGSAGSIGGTDDDAELDDNGAEVAGGETDDEEEITDVASWLSNRKSKWAASRASRKRRLENGGRGDTGTGVQPNIRGGMSNYVRDSATAALQGHWQILAITPTRKHGFFRLFALTSKATVRTFTLEVPRTIYVNSHEEASADDQAAGGGGSDRRVVLRTLPRDAPPLHLVQLKLREEFFVHKSKALDRALTHKHVEGVYETQVPLDFVAIKQLGCVTRIKPSRREALQEEMRRGEAATFQIDDFDMLSCAAGSNPYLEDKSAVYDRMWLYHSTTDSRGVWATCVRDSAVSSSNSTTS